MSTVASTAGVTQAETASLSTTSCLAREVDGPAGPTACWRASSATSGSVTARLGNRVSAFSRSPHGLAGIRCYRSQWANAASPGIASSAVPTGRCRCVLDATVVSGRAEAPVSHPIRVPTHTSVWGSVVTARPPGRPSARVPSGFLPRQAGMPRFPGCRRGWAHDRR